MNRMDQRFKEINNEKQKKFNNMNITEEQPQEFDPKVELINDLIAVTTIMEDYYRFHPANPKQENVVEEYAKLEAIKTKIEEDLNLLDIKVPDSSELDQQWANESE
jgi:hypothetical protein|tara:strand:+ start:1249 stop:1566 length:318 start_codon:yes stop_codon:yes gene_type:complete